MTTTTTQPELPLLADPDPAKNVSWLEDTLKSRACWCTAYQLLLLIGQDDTDTAKRQLRQLASASRYVISGQKGYKHIDHATAEEIDHACNWLESQGRLMIERSQALRKNAHKIFG